MTEANEGILIRLRKLVEGMELDDRFVTEIVVLVKTSNPNTGSVGIAYNYDTKDWIIRKGMLAVALDLEDGLELQSTDDDEDE